VHVRPAAQVTPHAPQLVAEVDRSVSQPFEETLSQFEKLPVQAVTWHAPPMQICDEFAPAQALPQAPQCCALAVVLVSHPLVGLLSQSP
jgi:hypothetical protein